MLRLEQERIFRGSWTYACPAVWVAGSGEFAVCEAGDVPLVVVRGRDGELRAFVNVCRHRGSQIVSGRGRRETLQCPYHAWTYDLDGSLRTAPRSEREVAFDTKGLSLRPALVRELGPLVFVCPDLDAPPLEQVLGPVARDVDLGSLVFRVRKEHEVGANWKIAVENYLECYHCPVAHPGFSRLVETSPDEYLLEVGDGVWSQFGQARNGDGSCQFHLVWPTLRVNVYPGFANLSIGQFWPLGPERTASFLDSFFGRRGLRRAGARADPVRRPGREGGHGPGGGGAARSSSRLDRARPPAPGLGEARELLRETPICRTFIGT